MAFHEKAGRSQVGTFWFLLVTIFVPRRVATVATLPFALSVSDFVARCKLGVLVTAGAATRLSTSRSIYTKNVGHVINAVTGTRLREGTATVKCSTQRSFWRMRFPDTVTCPRRMAFADA